MKLVIAAALITVIAFLGSRLSFVRIRLPIGIENLFLTGEVNRVAGMAYLTQAGVSLGLAIEVARRFPDWGHAFVTIVVAVIAVNQMVGPIAMKRVLIRVGEARRA